MVYLKVIRPILSKIVFKKIAAQFSEKEKNDAKKFLDKIFFSLKNIDDIVQMNKDLVNQGFIWKQDPGKEGVLDFSPEDLWLFIARKGDDCDGWAELNYQACKRINLNPKIWVIVDGWKVSTAHVITVCYNPDNKKFYLFNNDSITPYDTEEHCFTVFSEEPAIMESGVYVNLGKYLFKK